MSGSHRIEIPADGPGCRTRHRHPLKQSWKGQPLRWGPPRKVAWPSGRRRLCREVAPGFAFKIHSAVLFLSVLENVTYKWILFSSGSLAWVDRFQGPGVFVISDSRGPWGPRRAGPASPSVPQSPSRQLLWKGLRASARTSVAGRATASGHRLPVSGSSGPPAAPTRGLRPACPARFQSGCQGSPSPPFSSASLPHSAPSAAGGRGGDRPILRCRPCASPCSRVAGPAA